MLGYALGPAGVVQPHRRHFPPTRWSAPGATLFPTVMSATPEDRGPDPATSEVNRRDLFSNVGRIAMTAGLVAGYGTAGLMAGAWIAA